MMDIERIINQVMELARTHPVLAAAAGLVFIFLLIRKPKLIITFIFIAVMIGGVLIIISKLFQPEIAEIHEFNK